ncbi:MAG: protein kinase [Gemmataceae bacterium]|nr:protein kinase [Gemmataceae bacterium]
MAESSPPSLAHNTHEPGQGDSVRDPYRTRLNGSPPVRGEADRSEVLAGLRFDQRQRWREGDRVRVEDYQAAAGGALDDDAMIDLLFGEVLLREAHGEAPAIEELVARFPRLEERIRERFALHVALHSRPRAESPRAADALDTLDSGPRRPAGEGVQVPGYEILKELGRGGMGVVYKARQVALNRIVALKMILSGAHADAAEKERFRAEAKAAARVQHPNLVQIYDVGEHDGRPFFSLEFVDGRSLAEEIRGQQQAPRAAAELVATLAQAVHAIHQADLVHRDLKPANVLLTRDRVPKVADFGLAKRLDGSGNTATGDVLGTPVYMAPEQAAGKIHEIGPWTDVYALGVILYEMLAGRPPFLAASVIHLIRQVASDEPVPPSRLHPKLPRDLETICLKCLEKNPRKRYASAQDLADDLRRFLADEPIRARPVGRLQRAVKWVRRRPAVASLVGVSAAAALALLVGGLLYNVRLQAALHEAHDRGEQTRQLLVRLSVGGGTRLLDEGNSLGSLVWFTQALNLDRGHPERERSHRMRLAAVLHGCPSLRQLWFHNGAVRGACFSPNGKRVAAAVDNGQVHVYSAVTGAPTCPPLRLSGSALDVEFSPDGRRLLTVCGNGSARVWNADHGFPVTPLLQHGGEVACAHFSPDGARVLTAGEGKAARLWDAATGRPLPVAFAHGSALTWACFSPDGRRVATAGADGAARVWDAETGVPITPPLRHQAPLTRAAFSPDGCLLVTAGQDCAARLWDAATGKELVRPMRHARAINHVAFSADGRGVVTAGDDRAARVWRINADAMPVTVLKQSSDVNLAEFSACSRWVLTVGDDNSARLWDARSGDLLPPWLPHSGTVHACRFSPDGRHVLTASSDSLLRLWDVSAVLSCRESRDGQDRHATPAVRAATGQVKARSPDGTLTVTVEACHAAQVRDARTGAPVGQFLQHGSVVLDAAFSPDGRRVATASDDNTARLWDARTGRLLVPPMRHNGAVRHVAFSPDGLYLATASDDESARVWDALTGEAITPALPHPGPVRQVAFTSGGAWVCTTTFDGVRRQWRLRRDERSLEELTALAELLAARRLDANRGFLPLEVGRMRTLWEKMRAAR